MKRTRRSSAKARGESPDAAARPAAWFASLHWGHILLAAVTVLLLSALMSVNLMPDRIALKVGEISRREVRASRTVIYVNSLKTAEAQRAARRSVRPVYDHDEQSTANATRIVQEFFSRVESERNANKGKEPKRGSVPDNSPSRLQASYPTFSRSQFESLLSLSPALLHQMRDTALSRVRLAMSMDIHDKYDETRPSNDLAHAQEDLAVSTRAVLSPENAAIVAEVGRLALQPNMLYSERETERARDAAAHQVSQVYEQITPGDKIIGAGETVTQDHLDKFTALGLRNPHIALETGIGVFVLAACMVLLVIYFISRTIPVLYRDTRRLTLLAIIVLISVFGLKLGGTLFGFSFSSGQAGYLGMMTVVAAGMLVSVLLDMQLAVLIVALLAVQSGLIMNHEIRFTVMTLMSSMVGIFAVGSVRRKAQLPSITIALATANLALVWLTGLIQRDTMQELLSGSIWAVGAGAFATFLYWFGVLSLERPFGILTHTSLLEMSAADRPLLRQLCTVAPGTYAHSMMVGTLAEAAAQAVGADALLCRVAGYYHDIGKMRRPEFFVENQRNGNVHGRLSPSLSALIVTAHVRDGLEIAHEHRLPKEIKDVIAEHHGTTLIRYFYHQALTDCGGTDEAPPGLEERFRYPGPKPQALESAIVMLADSVEAAARTVTQPTRESLSCLINGIVRDKMEDGQFDECRLTFAEVKQITEAFLHVLTAMMHSRIDYPKDLPKSVANKKAPVAAERDTALVTAQTELPSDLALRHPAASETEQAPIPVPSFREPATAPLGAVGIEGFDPRPRRTAPPRPAAPGFPNPRRPLRSTEVLYGCLPDERTEQSGAYHTVDGGVASPVARREPFPGAG